MTAYFEFDAGNDHCRIGATTGRWREGIAIDSRVTSGGHRWSDDDWQGRIDLHLRWADNLAQLFDSYVAYGQLWCEQRAKSIGAWHPMPASISGVDDEAAEREAVLAKYGPLGTGRECCLTGCDDAYYATAGGLDLCVDHFDQIRDLVH